MANTLYVILDKDYDMHSEPSEDLEYMKKVAEQFNTYVDDAFYSTYMPYRVVKLTFEDI